MRSGAGSGSGGGTGSGADVTDEAREYADHIPDEPRWVDARGLLLSRATTVIEGDGGAETGFVVVAADEPVGAVVGSPGKRALEAVIELAASGPPAASGSGPGADAPFELLVQPEDLGAVTPYLTTVRAEGNAEAAEPGWDREGATLHRYAPDEKDPAPPPLRPGAEVRVVGPEERADVSAEGLPEGLYRELERSWDRGRAVAVAFVGGVPAGFCTVAVETETLWDVYVDTLEAYRRGGLAAACFDALARHMESHGKQPVWGAHDANAASLDLAERLGFVPEARLEVFVRRK